jgi:hypothetical protein
MYTKECRSTCKRDTYTPMFITALFKIASMHKIAFYRHNLLRTKLFFAYYYLFFIYHLYIFLNVYRLGHIAPPALHLHPHPTSRQNLFCPLGL